MIKVTEIYLIRHCEALGNSERLFQGVIDTQITETGRKQLSFLAERFKNIKIDKVFSSPLTRTVQTAHAVADVKGLEVNIAEDFIEMNCGIYEGKPFSEVFRDPILADIWNNHPQDFSPEGGETQSEVNVRILAAVKRIAEENKGRVIAVATHGGVLRNLFAYLKFGTIERMGEMPYADNTAVSLLCVSDDGEITVNFMNDSSHLPEEFIPAGSRVPMAEETE